MSGYLDMIARMQASAPPPRNPQRRDFAAAGMTRLTSGWTSSNTSANADLFRGLDTLRARSRDLCNNNDYGKRFLGMVGANVVGGTGVRFDARIYDKPSVPDTAANDAVEASFARWGARGSCDVSGRMSWRDLQILIVKTVARDGEALVRIITGKAAGNAFGFALQVLDVDRLDTRLMRMAENGVNEIRMGVEVDSFGRAVAYWLRPYHPGDQWYAQGQVLTEHQRIPAAEILHIYNAERPEQLRGVPWMHAAMTRLNNLGGYEEAAVIAARIGASKMGFFTTPDGSPTTSDGDDETGVPFTECDPGQFGVLPDGTTFESFNPDYPHAMYADFTKACLRGISSGLGVAYHALANDLTSVSFSSIRSGTLEERDQWISIQQWFIDCFHEPIYTAWLKNALAFGQIVLASGNPLPLEKIDKFTGHSWQGRRWQWVDPLRDMEANITAIQNGLKAPQDVAAELGVDYEDVLVKIKQAQDMADKIGVKLGRPDPAALNAKAFAQILAAIEPRSAPVPAPAAPATVALNIGDFANVAADVAAGMTASADRLMHDIRRDLADMNVTFAPQITIDVAPTPVELSAEITNVVPPQNITVQLPNRRTDTTVKRDADGNLTHATQIETDL